MKGDIIAHIIEKINHKRARRCSMAMDDFACAIAAWKERYPDAKLDEKRLWQDYGNGEVIDDLSFYVET